MVSTEADCHEPQMNCVLPAELLGFAIQFSKNERLNRRYCFHHSVAVEPVFGASVWREGDYYLAFLELVKPFAFVIRLACIR